MAWVIKTYTTFLLVLYLTSFTTEVRAPAAPDYWIFGETTEKPLVTNTAQRSDFEEGTPDSDPHCCKGQDHNSDSDQTVLDEKDPFNDQTTETDDGAQDTTTDSTFVTCGRPPTFPYAKLEKQFDDQDLFFMGSIVSYKCKNNYETISGTENKAKCMSNGNWSIPSTAFCKPNFCSPPQRLDYAQPADAFLDKSTFPKNSRVIFTCRPGYVRSPGGRNYATCLSDGTWSLPSMSCKRKSCGNPGEVENADMEAEDFYFGSRVTYKCNAGYRMIGRRNYRECQADGSWSNALPICEIQLCPPPQEISNGEINPLKEEYSYLDSVTYTCRGGLSLIGERSISCKEDGEWSAEAPKCKDVKCPPPYVNNARRISGVSGPYSLNSVVMFMCNQGYVMRGSDNIKCNETNQWDPEPPKCLGVCKYLPVIDYAELAEPPVDNQYLEGMSLTFQCKAGYDPVPDTSNVLTCLGPRWSSYATFCTPRSCGHPGPITNGYIASGKFVFGSGVTYACQTGYKIKENSFRSCQSNGNWSLPVPECEVQTCPPPSVTTEMSFIPQKNQYQYSDTVTFTCKEGYRLTGQSQSRCNDEGRWIPAPPTCKSFCYAPSDLEFAVANPTYGKEIFYIGEKVHYTCKMGYFKNSYENSLTCLGSLKWSHPHQFCSRIHCGPPTEIPNGEYKAKDFLFESEAVYTCSKGYKLKSGINSRKCLANREWSVPAPECEVQRCPPPEDLEHGTYSNKKDVYNYLDSVTYKCNNLTLVGEASVSCTEEGNWTSGAPECKPVCKFPPQLEYGELKSSPQKEYFKIGTVMKYQCRPGYVAAENKSNEVICYEDLKWSKPEEFCKRISCDHPGEIPNGKMHFNDFLFESRVNYTCKEGYTMISRQDFRYCQADGTWSGKSPVCKESICDNIWEMQEEARKCTSTPDEWIKYLQVQYLYLQIENLKLDIEIKKKKMSKPGLKDRDY